MYPFLTQSNQKECLKNTNNNIKFCERDLRDFDSYLRVYQKQVADVRLIQLRKDPCFASTCWKKTLREAPTRLSESASPCTV